MPRNWENPNKRQPTRVGHTSREEQNIVLEIDIYAETPAAWRCKVIKYDYEAWFPKSQCELIERNMSQYLSIPLWLHTKKLEEHEEEL